MVYKFIRPVAMKNSEVVCEIIASAEYLRLLQHDPLYMAAMSNMTDSFFAGFSLTYSTFQFYRVQSGTYTQSFR